MHNHTDRRYREGGLMDDVAQNIRNERRGEIDRNPSIPCARCEESFRWSDYWKPRVVDGDRVEEPNSDEPWRCDECHREVEQLKRRTENNQQLTEWER